MLLSLLPPTISSTKLIPLAARGLLSHLLIQQLLWKTWLACKPMGPIAIAVANINACAMRHFCPVLVMDFQGWVGPAKEHGTALSGAFPLSQMLDSEEYQGDQGYDAKDDTDADASICACHETGATARSGGGGRIGGHGGCCSGVGGF